MSKTLLYLTLPVMFAAIKNVLDTYPYSLCQDFFVISKLQQKLISYIFKQVREHYTVVIYDSQVSLNCSKFLSSEQWLHIEEIIRKGIDHLLQKNSVWDNSYMYKQMCDRVHTETDPKKNEDEIDAWENRTMALIKLDECYRNSREEVLNSYDMAKEAIAKGDEIGIDNILKDNVTHRL